jgi:hypothetical protein
LSPATGILASVIALAFLHLIMSIALYATRIPAMISMKMSTRKLARPGGRESLPAWARNVADNYNHLAEAPTVFYAVAIVIVVLGQADLVHLWCASAYVALRYAHSAVHATVNIILVRFAIFALSWVALGVMIVRTGLSLMG